MCYILNTYEITCTYFYSGCNVRNKYKNIKVPRIMFLNNSSVAGGGATAPWQELCPSLAPQMKLHFVQRSMESRHFEFQSAPPLTPEPPCRLFILKSPAKLSTYWYHNAYNWPKKIHCKYRKWSLLMKDSIKSPFFHLTKAYYDTPWYLMGWKV